MSSTPPAPEEFLSGETGHVAGVRRTVTRTIGDALLDMRGRRALRQIDGLARTTPRRRVLALSIFRPGSALIDAAVEELQATRHDLKLELGSTATLTGGKFHNLNVLLEKAGPEFDWLLAFDDDVALPQHFLDRLVAVAAHCHLALAPPAQTLMSHAARRVTRRRANSIVLEARLGEIGPAARRRRDAAHARTAVPDRTCAGGPDVHRAAPAGGRGGAHGVVDDRRLKDEAGRGAPPYRRRDAIHGPRARL